MGSKTNAAVTRRQSAADKARDARIKLHRDRDAKDTRVEAATAEVFTAQDQLTAADEMLTSARAAAAAAVAAAETGHAAATRAGESAIGDALRKLVAEKLTAAEIAELTSLPAAEVRRLTKPAPAAGPATVAGATGRAEPVATTPVAEQSLSAVAV